MPTTSETNDPFKSRANPGSLNAGAGGLDAGAGSLSFESMITGFFRYARAIGRKWHWGLLAGAILGSLVAFQTLRKPPEFTAETTLLAETEAELRAGSRGGSTVDAQSRENVMRNHISVLDSGTFRDSVAATFTPEELASISGPYEERGGEATSDWMASFLARKVSLERERGREFFSIRASHMSPDMARLIANRYAQTYTNMVQKKFAEETDEKLVTLRRDAETLRQKIAKQQEARLEFRLQNNILNLSENQGGLVDRMKKLEASMGDARISRIQLESRLAQVKADLERLDSPWENAYLATVFDNQALRTDLNRAIAERDLLATKYGVEHPRMKSVDTAVKNLRALLRSNCVAAVADLQSQVDVVRENEKNLKADYDAVFSASIEMEKLLRRYEGIGEDVEALDKSLDAVNRRIDEAIVQSQVAGPFVRIVDVAAIVPPKIPKIIISAFSIAFAFAIGFLGAAIIANAMDKKLTGFENVELLFGVSLVGSVPRITRKDSQPALIVQNNKDVAITESFLGIVGSLELHGGPGGGAKTILISSILPGEGKSTISSNLASAFTKLGKKTILVDLDLRRPSLEKVHGIKVEHGLAHLMTRAGSNDVSYQDVQAFGLTALPDGTHLMPAAGTHDQPSALFGSERFRNFLAVLRQNYDVVLFDTPPAALFRDSEFLARFTDQQLIVARVGSTPIPELKVVLENLSVRTNGFAGLVVNGFNPNATHVSMTYGYDARANDYAKS